MTEPQKLIVDGVPISDSWIKNVDCTGVLNLWGTEIPSLNILKSHIAGTPVVGDDLESGEDPPPIVIPILQEAHVGDWTFSAPTQDLVILYEDKVVLKIEKNDTTFDLYVYGTIHVMDTP
jgi:hypothetical protein